MAERVLLIRALSEMGTLDAAAPLADILATDPNAWRWEQKRVVWRMGPRALPLLLVTQNHGSPAARRWARWGVRELGLGDPGRAVQMEDMVVLARLLRAYGTVRDMDAMPVIVTFVTHERGEVREAARWATERFGQNAVWQLRRVYRNFVGEPAPGEWNAARTAEALYAAYDEQRLAPVRADLEAGLAALAAGDLDAMQAKFDDVLARAPELPRRAEMAPGYAALAARAAAQGNPSEAVRLYRRAVRLAPASGLAPAWQAELAFLEAEARLATGVADEGAYERVLALSPNHAGATRFLAEVRGEGVLDASWLDRRRLLAALAALLLAAAIGFILRRRAGEPTSVDAEPAEDATPSAEDTLPG
jgi:tetratricopeptide (TPR) repeat protein